MPPGCDPQTPEWPKTAVSWTISRLTRGLSANDNALCRPRRRLALFCSLSLEHTSAEKILSERCAGSTATRSRRRRRMHPISLNTRPAARDRLPAQPDAAILRPSDLRCHGRSDPPAGDPFAVQSRGSQTLAGTILHRGRRPPRHVERRQALRRSLMKSLHEFATRPVDDKSRTAYSNASRMPKPIRVTLPPLIG